jgi:glucose-1-phosphate adenylyltransferase
MGNDCYRATGLEVGEDSVIKKAIIDKNVNIGKRVLLVNHDNVQNFDGENLFVRDGIIVVPSGSSLPDDFSF